MELKQIKTYPCRECNCVNNPVRDRGYDFKCMHCGKIYPPKNLEEKVIEGAERALKEFPEVFERLKDA